MGDRCRRVEPLLSAWVDDELSAGEREEVARHVDRCQDCRAMYDDLRVTRSLLRALPTRRVPERLPARIGGPAHRESDPGWGLSRVALLVAASAGLIAGAAFSLGAEPERVGPLVRVPMDAFVVDHVVQTLDGPLIAPAPVGQRP